MRKKGENMDRYTKFILTVIAVALIGILFKDAIIMDANAELDRADHTMIRDGFKMSVDAMEDIASAIKSRRLSCN